MDSAILKNEVFLQPYDRERWKTTLRTFFPNSDFFAEPLPEYLTEGQKTHAKAITRLGTVILGADTEVAFFEVELRSGQGTNIQRNRVGLRRLIDKYVQPGGQEGGLFIFFDPQLPEWRFSFVSKEFYWDENSGSRRRVTEPRRYTYIFGPNESVRTATDRFALLLERRTTNLDDLLQAFSVEKVSREFFKGYKSQYTKLEKILLEKQYQSTVFKEKTPEESEKALRDFARKTLGRIVFLYFLQKKRWLGASSTAYQDGDPHFFRNLFENFNQKDQFYQKALVPLFFETLNQRRKDDRFPITQSCVPYLNGSLFEQEKKGTEIVSIPEEYFEKLIAFFDQYNFTIDENSPEDADIGIDPEMLGIIFEQLLEENQSKGVFYTPKPVVRYMCQDILHRHLEEKLGSNEELTDLVFGKSIYRTASETWIESNKKAIIRELDSLKICDPAIGSGAFPMGLLMEIFRIHMQLDWELDPAETKRKILKNVIHGVDIDPGAIDIARLRCYLSLVIDEQIPHPLPNLDFKIMQGNSLLESFHGLSLQLQPPSTPQLFGNLDDIANQTRETLPKLVKQFFSVEEAAKKEEIRNKIDNIIASAIRKSLADQLQSLKNSQLEKQKAFEREKKIAGNQWSNKRTKTNNEKDIYKLQKRIEAAELAILEIEEWSDRREKPYFLWHLYFKDVFAEGGFDFMIGNPPYVRHEKITELKPWLKEDYKVFNSTADLYTYFFELGVKMLKPGGRLSYIVSKQYTRGHFGKPLRKYLLEHCTLENYLDFQKVEVFAATVDTSIITLQKQKQASGYNFSFLPVKNDLEADQSLKDYGDKGRWKLMNSRGLSEERFSFLSDRTVGIMTQMEKVGRPLGEWEVRINYGIKTGLNEAFVIDGAKRAELIAADSGAAALIKPFLRGRDVQRYHVRHEDLWLIFTRRGTDIEQFPSIKAHLNQYYPDLKPKKDRSEKRGRKPGPYKWFEIQDNIAYFKEFESPKVIWKEISDTPQFSVEEGIHFSNNKTCILTKGPSYFIAAVLASQISKWYFTKICAFTGEGTPRWELTYVSRIPIPLYKEVTGNTIISLSKVLHKVHEPEHDRISEKAPNKLIASYLDRVMDACVFELYFQEHLQDLDLCVLEEVKKEINRIHPNPEAEWTATELEQLWESLHHHAHPVRQKIDLFEVKSPWLAHILQGKN